MQQTTKEPLACACGCRRPADSVIGEHSLVGKTAPDCIGTPWRRSCSFGLSVEAIIEKIRLTAYGNYAEIGEQAPNQNLVELTKPEDKARTAQAHNQEEEPEEEEDSDSDDDDDDDDDGDSEEDSKPVQDGSDTKQQPGVATMAQAATKKTGRDIQVDRTGDKIVVPEHLNYDDAIAALTRRKKEEEEPIAVMHEFNMTVPEGMVALLNTLRELYGFVNPTSTPSWFGPQPPTFLAIDVAPGVTEQVPWGRIVIPGVSGHLDTSLSWKNGCPVFMLSGQVKGKDKNQIQKIADRMREMVRERSLYRGKAIRVKFVDEDEASSMDDFFPKFVDTADVKPSDLIFPRDTQELVDVTLFTPIEHSGECRDLKIPLRRGILLEGPYGVGKTLTANVTASKCVEHGWTFIYLEDVTKLKQALEFARHYQPAVVFAEDIDQVLGDPSERDEDVNDILNSIDGIGTKNAEVITVLTTNNLTQITQAMLRPGRLDTVVPVRPPDAEAAVRLVQLFAGKMLDPTEDTARIGEALAGKIPAVIREVVERSKLSAVRRLSDGGELRIVADDIVLAAQGMATHLKLLQPLVEDKRCDMEKAADRVGEYLVRMAQGRGASNGAISATLDAPVAAQLGTTARHERSTS